MLFGSDYPMWAPEKDIQALLDMDFSEEDYNLMFCENTKRIFINR